MNLNEVFCADIETDGLLSEISIIHVLSFAYKSDCEWRVESTNKYFEIKKFFNNPNNVIAIHNGIRFDKPAVEKVLGIEVKAEIIDTLALAWYIDHGRPWNEYGLEWYGESFGVPKPEITDWKGLTYEQYAHRCSEDVKITGLLWQKLLAKLRQVYDNDQDIVRIIRYLNFIMKCSYKQEEQGIEVDLDKVRENLLYFESLKSEKVEQLKLAMPKLAIKRTIKKPKDMYKKDGKLSVAGTKWLELNPAEGVEEMEVITGYQEANPNSVQQKKAWLYSLNWKPQTFAYKRDKETGEVKKIEQIQTEEKELCPSVLKLKDKDPAIELLAGVSVLTHRIGILKSLLDNQVNGFITQGLVQLAVTLRWQHATVVNFPRVTGKGDIRDGKWIRECLIAGKGNRFVQSDLSGIESRTSDHYTFPINPGLIEERQAPYFDPHLQIAVASNLMTKDEEVWFKWKKENKERKEKGLPELPVETFGSLSQSFKVDDEKKLMDRLKLVRSKAKTTNYASLYNVGASTLSRNLDISRGEAQKLIDGYWKINYAVKEVTKTFQIKQVGEEQWVLNPISKFWHHLRNEKDVFSVTNQSSAVYCFNMWLYNVTKQGVWPVCQSHDDQVVRCHEKDAERVKQIILKALEKTNEQLKLNVPIACEVQLGQNLSETH
jgi:hypothetical protein